MADGKDLRIGDPAFWPFVWSKVVTSLVSVKVEVVLLVEAASVGLAVLAGVVVVRRAGPDDLSTLLDALCRVYESWVGMQKVIVPSFLTARVVPAIKDAVVEFKNGNGKEDDDAA